MTSQTKTKEPPKSPENFVNLASVSLRGLVMPQQAYSEATHIPDIPMIMHVLREKVAS